MTEMEIVLGVLFRVAIVANACSFITFLGQRYVKGLRVIPWMSSALGLTYFAVAHWYFSQPEVSLGVPIRVDIVFLGPLLLFSIGLAVSTLKRKKPNNEIQATP